MMQSYDFKKNTVRNYSKIEPMEQHSNMLSAKELIKINDFANKTVFSRNSKRVNNTMISPVAHRRNKVEVAFTNILIKNPTRTKRGAMNQLDEN